MAAKATQLKKLSVATVWGKIDAKTVLNATEPIALMTVYGMAVGVKTGTSSYGDWTALLGQFKAIHAETGELFESPQLFLPEVALVPLRVALAAGDARSVKFAIKLLVKESASRKPGGSVYEYTFENVLAPAEDDPILALESEMRKQGLLPAPDDDNGDGDGDGKASGDGKPSKRRR
jgi:hypothetical protein